MPSISRTNRARLGPLSSAVHGGLPLEQIRVLGLDPDQVLDFSVNTNPFGPSPKVLAALREVDITRYPDPETTRLREALSQALGVPMAQVLPGNGAVELIWLTARAYLTPGNCALVVGPTFSEYAQAALAAGADVVALDASPEEEFRVDLGEVARILAQERPQVAYLCNPNNPTATFLAPATLRPLVEAHADTLFVVDEAYLSFLCFTEGATENSCLSFGPRENLLVLRSMTKDCAIPGLRLGYAVGQQEVLKALRAQQPPWSVNALAQAAGVAALGNPDHLLLSLAGIQQAKSYLIEALTQCGLKVLPSSTNFLLVRVGDGAAFQRALLRQGCYLRDCASFGLSEYVRIGVRTLAECQRLAEAITKLQTQGVVPHV